MICCKRLLVYTGKLPSRKVVPVYISSDLHLYIKSLKIKEKVQFGPVGVKLLKLDAVVIGSGVVGMWHLNIEISKP